MFKKNALLRALMAAGLTTGLAACGGGSSGGGDDSTLPPPGPETSTGQFVDSPVSGLEYRAQPSNLEGLTNDTGHFQYVEGDTIKFSVGNFYLGQASGSSVITPVTLTNNTPEKTENIARFLQTLDDDGFPGNGITITASTRAAAANQNPTDIADADLSDSALTTAIIGLTSANTAPQTAIVSAEDANDHLSGTLDQLNPVESCSDDRAVAVTNERLAGKSFGFIRSDELGVYRFNDNGTLNDWSYDTERWVHLRDGDEETWQISNGGNAITFGRDDTARTVCSTKNYLLFEEGEDTAKLYDIRPYTLPTSAQSFIIGTLSSDQKAILTVTADGGLDYFPVETPISDKSNASVDEFGALNLDFDEGGVIDKIYFLAGQSSPIGVYLDYDEEGDLATVGTATMIATASNVSEATLKGSTLVSRHEKENETIILRLYDDYKLKDFANDYYQGDTQKAQYSQGTWNLNGNQLTLKLTNDLEDTVFQVLDAGTFIYFGRAGTEEGGLNQISKTQPITDKAFLGTYNVNVPTENTVNRELVVKENGVCVYSNTACTWTIDSTGKAQLDFGSNQTGTAHIWQLAGSNDQFAHVMTHSNDVNDIEPGFMTRK